VSKAGAGVGTVTSSPAGINCGPTCAATFADGTSVTLRAAVPASSRFVGWSGDCSGTSSCVLSMTANRAVTATFAKKKALTPASCIVPNVVGLTLAKARAKLVMRHCRVGSVAKKASSLTKRGKVIGQSPRAGRRLRNGAKVNLTLGKGLKT
jgi:hypothetical protein